MSLPFAFPPPPPPPPPPSSKSAQSNSPTIFNARGGQRGRADFVQRGRGRGQGNGPSRGGYDASYSNRVNATRDPRGGYQPGHPQQSHRSSYLRESPGIQHDYTNARPKRNHSTAFTSTTEDALRRSRPLAPPAVPDFGVNFDVLLQKKNTSAVETVPAPTQSSSVSRKSNLLGLTPRADNAGPAEEDDTEIAGAGEDEDEDEEAALARSGKINGALQFEYRGQKSTLDSSEDIAAWIAERRKRWPTEAKRDSATKLAEEKQRKWEEEKAARVNASREAARLRQDEYQRQKTEREKSKVRQNLIREQINKARDGVSAAGTTSLTEAQRKAERLRRKAEKVARQLKIAEAVLEKTDQQANDHDHDMSIRADADADVDVDALLDKVELAAKLRHEAAAVDVDDLSSPPSSSNADDTSSSGSSGSDSDADSDQDAGPEELTSKRTAPDRVPAPPRKGVPGSSTDTKPVCNAFARTGRCKFGRRCHYRHDKPDKKTTDTQQSRAGNRRKGLYQIMVDKEEEDERRNMVKSIIAMGNAGMLDDENNPHQEVVHSSC